MKSVCFLIILITFSATSCKDNDPIQIRVHNQSNLNFDEVEVLGKNFGPVGSGDFSNYLVFDVAYRALPVNVIADSKSYGLVVIDYVGETPLDGGQYTLRLNIIDISDENSLTQELIRD